MGRIRGDQAGLSSRQRQAGDGQCCPGIDRGEGPAGILDHRGREADRRIGCCPVSAFRLQGRTDRGGGTAGLRDLRRSHGICLCGRTPDPAILIRGHLPGLFGLRQEISRPLHFHVRVGRIGQCQPDAGAGCEPGQDRGRTGRQQPGLGDAGTECAPTLHDQ